MFQISTRLRYGLRALVYIASKKDSKTVNLHEISKNEGISRKYLENIFKLMKKNRIIKSVRGREGGYSLVKSAEELTLYEIAHAIEGSLSLLVCLKNDAMCGKAADCGVRLFWGDYQDYIKKYLEKITLMDVIERYMNGSPEIKC